MKSVCHELTGQIWELYHLKHMRYCANSNHHTTRLKTVFQTGLVLKIHILKKFRTVQHMNSETSTYHLSTDIDENLSPKLSSMTPPPPPTGSWTNKFSNKRSFKCIIVHWY